MQVARRGRQAAVTEQQLDRAQVRAGLEQMGGEAVPQGMQGHVLADPGRLPRPLAGMLDRADADVPAGLLAGKQPLARRPFDLPVGAQQVEQPGREHDQALLAALALGHAQDHALAVDVAGAQGHDLEDAQPGGIGGDQHGAHLEVRDGVQKTADLLGAEHGRQPPCLLLVRYLGTAQSRSSVTVYRNRRAATIMLK